MSRNRISIAMLSADTVEPMTDEERVIADHGIDTVEEDDVIDDAGSNIEAAGVVIDDAGDAVDDLQETAIIVERGPEEIPEVAVEMLQQKLTRIQSRFGIRIKSAAMESFGKENGKKIALESVNESIAAFFRKIWEALKTAYQYVVDFFTGLFDKSEKIKKLAEAVKKQAAELKDAKAEEGKIKAGSMGKWLGTEGSDTWLSAMLKENEKIANKTNDIILSCGKEVVAGYEELKKDLDSKSNKEAWMKQIEKLHSILAQQECTAGQKKVLGLQVTQHAYSQPLTVTKSAAVLTQELDTTSKYANVFSWKTYGYLAPEDFKEPEEYSVLQLSEIESVSEEVLKHQKNYKDMKTATDEFKKVIDEAKKMVGVIETLKTGPEGISNKVGFTIAIRSTQSLVTTYLVHVHKMLGETMMSTDLAALQLARASLAKYKKVEEKK